MKKIFFFVFIFTSTALSASLASCASPQGTVASQATVTFPPPTSTPKQTELTKFNQQTRFEGDDPRLLVGGGESPGRLVSLPQDVLAFLRNNHEGPIVNGDDFIARVSADGVCSVFTTDHLVDSGAVLSEVNDGRVVFSVDGTATVGQFRFPVPDGVACVASLAQEGSGFAPGTILVRFFRDNGKAGAQILNEEPIRPLVNAPNRIELVRLESGFQLITTGADGQEIEKQTVDTKGWAVAVEYTLSASKEEAQNNFFDYDFVMRGGPGEIAKLNAEPFPEDVITGLNVIVATPNYLNYEVQPYNYLYYDQNGKNIIKRNPGKEPYRNMGWFSFVNEVGQQGIGTVWQWINPDKSIVYLTTVGFAGVGSELVATPFVSFNSTNETPNFTTAGTIGKNQELNTLIQQWADIDIIPTELQNHALRIYFAFNP